MYIIYRKGEVILQTSICWLCEDNAWDKKKSSEKKKQSEDEAHFQLYFN